MAMNNNPVQLGSSINRVQNAQAVQTRHKPTQLQGNFDRILHEQMNEQSLIKFSKHAELRLQSRNIYLNQNQKEKITEAVKRAEDKGIRDSLVIMDNLAFVVSVKNRTVITAVNSSELKENVFTNIDGAVFA